MTRRFIFITAGLLASLAALPAFAETAPKSGSHDARVTYATYQEGQVYRINTRLRNVTLVELGTGEQIQSIAIGDLEALPDHLLADIGQALHVGVETAVDLRDEAEDQALVPGEGAQRRDLIGERRLAALLVEDLEIVDDRYRPRRRIGQVPHDEVGADGPWSKRMLFP